MTASDYADWRLVTIRQPQQNEVPPLFFNLDRLRGTDTLILKTPRVGFFTTPAFLAQWYTNPSNQARVTMNQALIAALDHAFDGLDIMPIAATPALDPEHANTPACFECHQNIDPMQQFFRHDYTLYFSPQKDENQRNILPTFAFDGVASSGNSTYDLGDMLASHPRFSIAWTQNLCAWPTSFSK